MVRALKKLIQEHNLDFVVVCGDLFDSASPDAAIVSALCSAIGELNVPVYAIPGNHDHSGPGYIWEQAFSMREQSQLAPNLRILLDAKPVVCENAARLVQRHSSCHTTSGLNRVPQLQGPFC
jgi:DNA repair exonuclease SbcCD nuclease subunit